MNIMTILGSPRNDGNSAQVLAWVEDALRSAGPSVDRVNLADRPVRGFEYSDMAGPPDPTETGIQVMDAMAAADGIILAAPVFCWGFPAQLKALIDRTIYLVGDFIHDPDYETKLQGKPLGLVLTSGGPQEDNAEHPMKLFEALVRFMKAKDGGCLHIWGFEQPDAMGDEVRQHAADYAARFLAT
ncbi:MAG TPA: NAD(P)H-dependent oxidoreductase [Candidatus Hydrogenedentes bacterium]|nr:NAD(P)H-dependent oxidoreductase [Candidatus Hydrogenedentota bacterium]HPG65283.1 NAD(P)H-dependent oxidoreductase [Candidatus Hydrogenedentota bacterium]